jgi:hypothetical protein
LDCWALRFIDNAAHLGGLCGGLALGWFFRPADRDTVVKAIMAKMSLIGVVVLLLLGVVAALAVKKITGYW